MKKILALTSIRSDYDLMSSLYRLLEDDVEIELKLVVSGAHLSNTYGKSISQIQSDGFEILHAIETLIDSDSKASRLKTASLFPQSAVDIVSGYAPDLILFAGDREDVIMGGLLGGFLEIPTLHFYGGDHVQDGHIDNPVRHATSKLATAHMVCLEEHRDRLIRMGESPDRIFTIGSIALDRFVRHLPEEKYQLIENFGLESDFSNFATLIFHPVAEEKETCALIFENILQALKASGLRAFVSTPNTDPGNWGILEVINRHHADPDFYFYRNLDRDTFLSVYKQSRLLIGNSSSGILESASVPIPVVNVGLRQTGRIANANVIFCATDCREISDAIKKAMSREFRDSISGIKNIYGDGQSALRAYRIIKAQDFKKSFHKKEDPLRPDVHWGNR